MFPATKLITRILILNLLPREQNVLFLRQAWIHPKPKELVYPHRRTLYLYPPHLDVRPHPPIR